MKLTTNILLSVFLLFYNIIISQENIEFQQLTGENVSTQSITYAIKQDKIGNVWIASEEGVLKHNSKYYKVYNTYNGLPESVNNRTTQLFIDSKQHVWIGLENGVCIYDEALDRFNLVKSNTDINPSLINSITEDSQGNIWVGGFNGLWKYNINSKNDKSLVRVINNHSIQALYSFNDSLFIGTPKGLFLYNSTDASLIEIKLNSDSKNISAIGKFNTNFLIGTKTGEIFEINFNFSKTKQIDFKNKISNRIKDFTTNSSNNLYIATDGDGIYSANKKYEIINHFKEDVDDPKSISSNGIYDIEIGSNDVLWIATYGGGINFYDANRLPFQKVQHQRNDPNSIISNFTRAIAIDKKGNIWFGTKKGISVWNTKESKWKHIQTLSKNKSKKQDIVLALASDNDFMWVGTYNNGFFKIDIDNYNPLRYNLNIDKPTVKKVYTIFKDDKNNIWIGGIEGDLTVIRSNNKIDTYPIRQIKSISTSNSGNILAAGKNGVYEINDVNKEFKLIEKLKPNKNTLAYSTVNSIHQTNDNQLVLATNGAGLVIYNPKNKRINKLTVKSGMPSDIVQGIIVTDAHNIWASTTKGLAHIIVTPKDTVINVFDKKDGLASTEFNYGSFATLEKNLLGFGGTEGVTLFNPNNIKGKSYYPSIVFNEFKLFNKAVKPGSKILAKHINITNNIILQHKENSIEIKFIGVLHNAASKIKYSWKLDGFDNQWSEPSYTNFATYTNLNSGKYVFNVKAANKYGDFGEIRSIKLKVASPWWASNKAMLLYFLLGLTLFYLVVHFTSVIIKKKNADEQIHFFNNITHEIKTPLTILLSSLDNVTENVKSTDESKKRIKTTIKRINSLFEQMLNFHKVTSQDNAIHHISKIIIEEHLNHVINNFKPLLKERNITITLYNNWNDDFYYFDKEVLDKIVRNLLSNAIKYANKNGKIDINLFKTRSKELKLEVIDNGIGIPKDQQKYILKRYYRARNVINSQRSGTGLGLVMVQKLIDKTNGSISFTSKENIGTTFTVLLKNLKKGYEENLIIKEKEIQNITNTLKLDDNSELAEFSNNKILIVEDNNELREILVNTLGVHFQIYEAENGLKGLEITNQIFPDIILTDLIMPEMDGMQMATKLKSDINLNHIPVFMMTVLQNSDQKLKSIEAGISEYIEKPIDMQYLLAKITNRLKWQRKLHKKYLHDSDIGNAKLFKNKNDQEFLENLENKVIENIANTTFSVHDLSSSFGMSRTSLYMKLKSLVDLSPQDFIIHSKFKFAKKMLIKGELSIKEVAYSSGFSNPKYFSTSFKKFYGVTPSSFLESIQAK